MKNIFIKIFIFLPLIFLFSCTEDSLEKFGVDSKLYVKLPETAQVIAFPNKEINFLAEVYAEAGITKVETKVDFETVDGSVLQLNGAEKNTTYPFNYTPTDEDLGKTLKYDFVVYDKNGFTSKTTYSVKIQLEPVVMEFTFPENLPDTLNIGDTLEFEIQITSEDDLAKIETIFNDAELPGLTVTSFSNPISTTYQFNYEIQLEDGGQDITFLFRATDIEGKFKEEAFSLFIVGQAFPKIMISHSDVTLGMQSNTTVGPFIDLETNSVYTVPNAKLMSSAIGLGALQSGKTGINLFAPSYTNAKYVYKESAFGDDNILTWAVRNETELRKVSSTIISEADFNQINDDRLVLSAFDQSAPSFDDLTQMAVGDIIVFKTVDDIYGVILVKSLESSSTGFITFDYKIQGNEFIIPINAYSDVTLGMQSNPNIGPFIDMGTNTVYTVPNGKLNSVGVDMGTFYSGKTGINIFAPSYGNAAQYIYTENAFGSDNLGSWSVKNNTQLREVSPSLLTLEGFNAIIDGQEIISVFNQSGNSFDVLTGAAEDKIFAFKTVNNKYGLMRVKSIVSSTSGNLVFDYKILQ